jgi:hypothetical protein
LLTRSCGRAAKHKAGLGDAADGGSDEEGVIRMEAEKAAMDRAKERISLKHRNTRCALRQ